MTAPLGLELAGLYDQAKLARELGVSRAAALKIMEQLPKVHVEGLRKVYVIGSQVEAYIQERTRPA